VNWSGLRSGRDRSWKDGFYYDLVLVIIGSQHEKYNIWKRINLPEEKPTMWITLFAFRTLIILIDARYAWLSALLISSWGPVRH
jgi:hypothetical protein